jgi:hypothetical protein
MYNTIIKKINCALENISQHSLMSQLQSGIGSDPIQEADDSDVARWTAHCATDGRNKGGHSNLRFSAVRLGVDEWTARISLREFYLLRNFLETKHMEHTLHVDFPSSPEQQSVVSVTIFELYTMVHSVLEITGMCT